MQALILFTEQNNHQNIKWVSATFCAGLAARLLGPGEADATLDGGGRARGRDILRPPYNFVDQFKCPQSLYTNIPWK